MKTILGKVTSSVPISLSDAAKTLSDFASSDHGASHSVSLYLQRASDSFSHLVQFHEKLKFSHVDVKLEEVSGAGEAYKVSNLENNVEIRRNQKNNSEIGVKEEALVMNEDMRNGFQEKKKNKKHSKEGSLEADMRNKEFSAVELKPDVVEEDRKSKSGRKDKVKDQKLVETDQLAGKSQKDELVSAKIGSAAKTEPEVEEVKEDGVISRDKKKKKKKRSVDDNEGGEVAKVEHVMGFGDEKTKKRKSVDLDAGEKIGSEDQSNKNKSKKRRIEGEK